MAWTYEQNFNALSNGDLNGQDGWSINAAFDVQGTVTFEGAKAVQVTGTSEVTGFRTSVFTSDVANWYFAVRTSALDGASDLQVQAVSSPATVRARANCFRGGAGTISLYSGTAWTDVATGLSANTWYVVNWDITDTQHRARVWQPSTGWGSFSSLINRESATTGDDVRLDFEASAGSTAVIYIDTFTATDPTIALKTVDGLARASVKTVNGLALASVKNINGLA